MSHAETAPAGCPVQHRAAAFDPTAPAFIRDPFSAFHAAQAEQPVFFSPAVNAWVVTRYEDLRAVLRDTETFSSVGAFSSASPEALGVIGGLQHPIYRDSLVNRDPPAHSRFRGFFQRAFTTRKVARLEPQIRELVHELLTELKETKRTEVVSRFCDPLPLLTICRLVGVPDADAPAVKRWTSDLIAAQIPGKRETEGRALGQSILDYYAYMLELTGRYALDPAENLLSTVLEAQKGTPEPLSHEEIAALTCNLVLAGHETTASLIGNTLHTLLDRRELWTYLCSHPERVAAAVDECARHGGPAVALYRRTTREVALGGVTIPRDAAVWVSFMAGNHDPSRFPDPERLDLSRADAADNLTFGYGVHYCVGAPLAKLELRLVLEELTRHHPSLRLEPGQTLEFSPNFINRAYRELVLVTD